MEKKKKIFIPILIILFIIVIIAVGLIYYFKNTDNTANDKKVEEQSSENSVTNTSSEDTSNTGRIEFSATDQDELPIIGMEMKLERDDGTLIGNVETGTDGKILYYSVPAGNYTLTQNKDIEGYVKNEEPIKITVNTAETAKSSLKLERITGKLVITAIDDNGFPLSNVVFNLYDSEGYLMKNVTTNDRGKAYINVDYGTYYFKSSETPEKYIGDDTMYKFVVNEGNRTFYKTVANIKYKGTVLLKVTSSDNTDVENVKYKFMDSNGTLINELSTNEKGLAGIANIPAGQYYLEQTEVPEGFKLDNEKIEIIIEDNNDVIRKDLVVEK